MRFTGYLMAEVLIVCAIFLGAVVAVETNQIGMALLDWMP